MGAIYVDVTIRNLANPSRSWRGPFLVDTGATDSVVPRHRLEAIGVTPGGQRTYELADGRAVQMDIAAAQIEFLGEFVGGTVVFGEPGTEPLLGVIALESMGVEVDPRNQELRKLSAVRLKTIKAKRATDIVAPIAYSMPISALTVDKLGVKLYDRASAVIAELISNSYDADATEVVVRAPLGKYLATLVDGSRSEKGFTVEVVDDGTGMTPKEMQNFFLPVGTERRNDPGRGSVSRRFGRKVMGRKGVGKLAPFGICKIIEVRSAGGKPTMHTLPDGVQKSGYLTSHVILNYGKIVHLGQQPSKTYRPKRGKYDCTVSDKPGTKIILRDFYKKLIPDATTLSRQIAQRFGICSPDWKIVIANNHPRDSTETRKVGSFDVQTMPNTMLKFSTDGSVIGPEEVQLDDIQAGFQEADRFYGISGWMAYSKQPYKDDLMAGVRIYCRGKIASQTSVFNRRAGFTGEHNIRSYLVGELHADWLDEDDDLILTDRRDILWSDRLGEQFQKWGQDMVLQIGKFARDPLRKATLELFLNTGNVANRINESFPAGEHAQIHDHALRIATMFGRTISRSDARDAGIVGELVDLSVLLAPHVTLDKIMRQAAENADTPVSLLGKLLRTARIAEICSFSRIAEDRIKVVQRVRDIVNNSSATEPDLQSLITDAPWLINPEWAPVTANQTLSTLRHRFQQHCRTARELKEFGDAARRPDFVLTSQKGKVQIVEIKAPGHILTEDEVRRIVAYHDQMEEFMNKAGNLEFKDEFGDFHITLVCDEIRVTGVAAHALKGLQSRFTHISWSVFLLRTERVHQDFLRAVVTDNHALLGGSVA